MKPAMAMPIVAALCLTGTGYAAFQHNQTKGAAADSALIAEATIGEAKQEAEKNRVHYLTAIAREVIVDKVPDVAIDSSGMMQRLIPKSVQKDQFFTIGNPVPESLNISSVGVRNASTGEYAAVAIKDRIRQIIFVYSRTEVQQKVNQIQKEGKQQ